MRGWLFNRITPGLAIIGAALMGCDSNPAATTTSPATVAAADTLNNKLIASPAISSAPAESGTVRRIPITDSGEADNPALHRPQAAFRKTVAPGLEVIIKVLTPVAAAVIRDPWDLRATFTIMHQGTAIYRDTATGMTYLNDDMPASIRQRYPLWIPGGANSGELLMAFDNRPSKELARRFTIRQGRVTGLDTLPVLERPARNLDADSTLEYSALYDYSEQWTDEQGRLRRAYNPTLYYEVRPNGLFLDSTLTIRKAKQEFGAFYGFSYSTEPVLIEKGR